MSASSRQQLSDAGFPIQGTPREKMGYALKYAMLAPTEIDWHPWEFQVTDANIELLARNDPGIHAVDPEGRELMIGCGSALVYLKLALRHFGCLGTVELFPALDQPRLAARIHFGTMSERHALDRLLFDATTQRPIEAPEQNGRPLPQTALAALNRVVDRERGWVEFAQSENSRQRLKEFLPNRLVEAAPSEIGAEDRSTSRFRFRVRRAAPVQLAEPVEQPMKLPSATLAVVKTKTDDRQGWLAAGHAMARIILQAQALGLAWGFFNHPVRLRYARESLRMHIGHKGFAQVILKLASLTSETPYGVENLTTRSVAFQW